MLQWEVLTCTFCLHSLCKLVFKNIQMGISCVNLYATDICMRLRICEYFIFKIYIFHFSCCGHLTQQPDKPDTEYRNALTCSLKLIYNFVPYFRRPLWCVCVCRGGKDQCIRQFKSISRFWKSAVSLILVGKQLNKFSDYYLSHSS